MKAKKSNDKDVNNRSANTATKDKRSGEKTNTQQQKDATAGEVPYAPTVGRHGVDDEKQLNPEE